MRRAYNHNISERANRSLIRREAQVRTQRYFIGITIIVMIALGIIYGSQIHVFAGVGAKPVLQKYYTSIRVEEGDTLWDIAGKYVADTSISRQEYMNEVCALNGICADEIYAGEYLVVMYYEVAE